MNVDDDDPPTPDGALLVVEVDVYGNGFGAVSVIRAALARRYGNRVADRFFREAISADSDHLLASVFRWCQPVRRVYTPQ